jgi:tetratricopeptide (TPR) repeat protein/capsular polysaccharide biosynthesis protein
MIQLAFDLAIFTDIQEYLSMIDLEEKINLYREKIKLEPENYLSYYNLAEALSEKELFSESIEFYQKSLLFNDKFVSTYLNLGKIYIKLNRNQEAISNLQKAVLLHPQSFFGYSFLGDAYRQEKMWNESAIFYEKALSLKTDFAWTYLYFGQVLTQLERWEDAVKAYENFIELNPDFGWSYSYLGKIFTKLEQWENALIYYQKCLEFHPDHFWSYGELGDTLFKLERWEEGIIAYQKAIQLKDDIDDFYYNLAEGLSKVNRLDEALNYYEKCLELNRKKAEVYVGIGRIKEQQGKSEEALNYFWDALKCNPEYHLAYWEIGFILARQGDSIGAQHCKYFALPPSFINQHFPNSKRRSIKAKNDPNIRVQKIYPAHRHKLLSSQTNEAEISPLFCERFIKSPPVFVATIPHARAWSCQLNSGIITANDQLISDFTSGCAEIFLAADKLQPPLKLDGSVAFLGVRWGSNYYHWMIDVLSRIDLLQKSGINLGEIDYFAFNQCDQSYQKETLKTLGIPLNKVVESRLKPHIKTPKLIVPSTVTNDDFKNIPKWACDFIRKQFLPQNFTQNPNYKRIYISRRNTWGRRVINEVEVMEVLSKYGFISVDLDAMSVAQQAVCFASAEVVIAPHGAGLTNIIFCAPGTKIMEIFAPSYLVNYYWIISNFCGLSHYYTLGEDFISPSKIKGSTILDMVIKLDSLLSVMKLAGI